MLVIHANLTWKIKNKEYENMDIEDIITDVCDGVPEMANADILIERKDGTVFCCAEGNCTWHQITYREGA